MIYLALSQISGFGTTLIVAALIYGVAGFLLTKEISDDDLSLCLIHDPKHKTGKVIAISL